MAVKLAVVVVAALTVVAVCAEREKRQSSNPDFGEYFNNFQEQMKPIVGQFPSLPNGGQFPSLPNGGQFPSLPNGGQFPSLPSGGQFPSLPSGGQFPSLPNGFGSFPSFPSTGGSSGSSESSSPSKRQVDANTMSEWFSQFLGGNFNGNLPFNPQQFGQFGQFPFPGSSSGSSGSSENESS